VSEITREANLLYLHVVSSCERSRADLASFLETPVVRITFATTGLFAEPVPEKYYNRDTLRCAPRIVTASQARVLAQASR
jgi:hypothetical protein